VLNDGLDHSPHLGRQSGQLFRTDRRRRHPTDIADFSNRANPNSNHHAVNGYWRRRCVLKRGRAVGLRRHSSDGDLE
jgi:hypothetical protein